jgi:Cadherin domain
VVRVLDENDNTPRFRSNGRPIVTVIPNTANFGYSVTQVEATDADVGLNADIKYSLLNEPSKMFAIDPTNGKIRVIGTLPYNSPKVYGFDVKASDRRGADDGKSTIVNVFVYVLDSNRQVRLVLSGQPLEVELKVGELTKALSEATGLDVRVRMIEPHDSESGEQS